MTRTAWTIGALVAIVVLVAALLRACGGEATAADTGSTRAPAPALETIADDLSDDGSSTDDGSETETPHDRTKSRTADGAGHDDPGDGTAGDATASDDAVDPEPSESAGPTRDQADREDTGEGTDGEDDQDGGGDHDEDSAGPDSAGQDSAGPEQGDEDDVGQEPDAATLAFLQGGLWNSTDEETPKCGRPLAIVEDRLAAGWFDPSDAGDFYAVCLRTVEPPDFPFQLTVMDPTGARVTSATVRPGPETARFALMDDPFPVLVTGGGDGTVRHNGLWLAGESHLVQLHLWLPHDRRAGAWTVAIAGHTTSMEVVAPCGSGDVSDIDPLAWSLDIAFAIDLEADDLDHCAAWPDLVGSSEVEALAAVDGALAARRTLFGTQPADDDAGVHVERRCAVTPAGTVVGQDPEPRSFDGHDRADAVVVVVSTGPCTSTTASPAPAVASTTAPTGPTPAPPADEPKDVASP